MIDNYQWKDKELTSKIKCANYYTKSFCGGGIVIQTETL